MLLLVPSQEALHQKYTETWEQWRAERPRDFEETGRRWREVIQESKNEVRSATRNCDVCDDKFVANTEMFWSDTAWRRITNNIFITNTCKLAKDQKHDQTKTRKILIYWNGKLPVKKSGFRRNCNPKLIGINWTFFTQICIVTKNCKRLLKTC